MIQALASPPSPSHHHRRITLKDIARKAGLSVAAVSMALRDGQGLAANTVLRVKKIARQLGYTPDPALTALAAYRRRIRSQRDFATIALVTNWTTRNGWTRFPNPADFIEGAGGRAAELGYSLQHFWAREDGARPERFEQILTTRGIQGLILAPYENPRESLPLDWNRFSVVAIEKHPDCGPIQYVQPDQFQAIGICWEKLRERGYRRVGLVLESEYGLKWNHQWEAAHSLMQPAPGSPDHVPTLQVDGPDAANRIRAWLRKYRPHAVINRSSSFHAAAQTEGLSIGHDLGYVTLNRDDDIEAASGIRQHWGLLGQTAIDLLHTQLQRSQRGHDPIGSATQICGTWQEGCTLPGVASLALHSRRPEPVCYPRHQAATPQVA